MPDLEPSPVVVDTTGPVTWVTLNRPEKANALTLAMMAELWETWEAFERDDEQHVLVLTGAGTRFCGGRDLSELGRSKGDDARLLDEFRPPGAPANWFYRLLPDVSKPTMCAVNGPAVGGGWALIQRCDLRVVVDSATLQINEIAHGLGAGNFLVELAREIPPALVMEMVQFGEPMTARRAYEIGLVNRIASAEDLVTVVSTMAGRLAELAPAALAANKQAILRSRYPDHELLWSYAQHAFDKLRRG